MHTLARNLAVYLLVIAPGITLAQSSSTLKATVRAERTDIQLGQPVAVIVEVKGCDAKPEIQAPNSDDCYITLSGKLAQPSMLAGLGGKGANGVAAGQHLLESLQAMTDKLGKDPMLDPGGLGPLTQLKPDDFSYVYHVHVKRSGTVTVPPFTVTANGQKTTTQPIDLHVAATRGQDMVRLELSLSNPRPMVGQEVRLNVDVFVRKEQVTYNNQTYPHLPLKDVHLTLPPLDRAGPLELVKPLEQVLKEQAPQPGHHGYKVNHLPYEAVFQKEPTGAKDESGWYRRRLEVPVRLNAAGKVALAAAGVGGEAWQRGLSSNRKTAGRWQPFVAASKPLDVEVRDLSANRPHGFSGNIGELKVSASASQIKMPAGTPFTLSVRLEGQGYQPHPGSVDLANNAEFTRRFRVHQDQDRSMSDTLREVTYTLRPLDPSVKEVPPITVSYFDSKDDQFKNAKSQAIPLEITPAAQSADATPTEPPPLSEQAKDDLPSLDDLTAAHQKGLFTRNFLALAALAVAGAIVAAALVGSRMRRGMTRLRQSQTSRAVARQHERAADEVRRQLSSSAQSVHDVRELVQRMLRTRFGMPQGEITPHDAAERLRQAGVADGLAHSCAELLEECAAAEFAPGVSPVSLPELTARAERLVAEITSAVPIPLASAAKR